MKKAFSTYGLMILLPLMMMGYINSIYAQSSLKDPDLVQARTMGASDIQVAVSGKLALCSHSEKGHIILTVTGGQAPYTYKWNTLETTKDRTNLYAGTYTVEITDSKGAVHKENIVVQPPYPLILNPIEIIPASCGSGADGSAKLSVKVGRGEPYKVTWSNGVEDQWEVNGLKPGTYSVKVADIYNCDVTVSFEVKSESEGISVQETTKDLSCSGIDDGAIKLTISGGQAPYIYSWSNGATTQNVDNLSAGNYAVTIKDQTGCSFTANYEVKSPAVMTLTESILSPYCDGNANGEIELGVIGGQAPYTYQWSNGQNSAKATNLSSGNYSVLVSDASGCIIEKQFNLSNSSNLDLVIANNQPTSCAGGEDGLVELEVIGASGDYSIEWSDGVKGLSKREDLAPGTYSISVKDASGCEITKSFEVKGSGNINARIESMLDVDCEEGSFTGVAWVSIEGGVEPYTIEWNNGNTNAREINYFKTGTLKVKVIDATGCSVITEAKVDYPNLNTQGSRLNFQFRKLEISSEPEVQVDEEIIFESEISEEFIAWEWHFGDGNKSSEKDPIHIFEKAGSFEVTLTAFDIYGCSSIEKNTVQVNVPEEMIVIPNAFTPNGDGLNDVFIPKMKAVSNFSMEVFNTWGERMFMTTNQESQGWDGTYKGQALPAGNYLYKITYTNTAGENQSRSGGITLIR
ncbi:gliding motility-associated C-terminal domain-containing protein [Algoriphagus lutimaris]|uniref:T9SS type B sorting domain-containing protein n=1 Tax=Algoriphagus lutimaris TaxID=613197 RepID=UPI00196B8116|nr:T9SS type B sorting domain-containing protein [Algoriphagus lutimaris]MBN3520915.1 gliding motility-associated C-terminal domain-containing protein [Algoriphagus lutimaris]